jgi:hypothetical protein
MLAVQLFLIKITFSESQRGESCIPLPGMSQMAMLFYIN